MRLRKRINFYALGCRLEDLGDSLRRFAWKVQDFSWKPRKPYTGPHVTLRDLVAARDSQYQKDCLAVMLETNEILADMPWQELPRAPVPVMPQWRKIYGGNDADPD